MFRLPDIVTGKTPKASIPRQRTGPSTGMGSKGALGRFSSMDARSYSSSSISEKTRHVYLHVAHHELQEEVHDVELSLPFPGVHVWHTHGLS